MPPTTTAAPAPRPDAAAVDQLSVLASLGSLHAFCRWHGWRVEVVAADGTRAAVDDWLACRAAVVAVRRQPDAELGVLRAVDPAVGATLPPDRPAITDAVGADLERFAAQTPHVTFLPARAAEQRAAIGGLRDAAPGVHVAYSIKTNPSDDALALARSCGCLAEAVSQLEVARALDAGFAHGEIVLNGPAKWWPAPIGGPPLRAVFCDSLPELASAVGQPPRAGVLGIRLRPPRPSSRFGVAAEGPAELAALARALDGFPGGTELGVHLHIASSDVGIARWFALCRWAIGRAAALQERSGIPVRCLDLGGGWHPDDLVDHLVPALPGIAATARAQLDELHTIVVEPGRALVQPTAALLTRVLEVRDADRGRREVLVDASVSEVADAARYPHPVLVRDRAARGCWRALGEEGIDRVVGRSCMETDILATGVRLPTGLAPGDLMAIDHVGAYDVSKSFAFGRG